MCRKIDSFLYLLCISPKQLTMNISVAFLCGFLLLSTAFHFYSYIQTQNNLVMTIYGSNVEKVIYNNETAFVAKCLAKNCCIPCKTTIGTFSTLEVADVIAKKNCIKNKIIVVNADCELDIKYEMATSIAECLFFVAIMFGIVAFIDFCAMLLDDEKN
jgi:hypothetical protein